MLPRLQSMRPCIFPNFLLQFFSYYDFSIGLFGKIPGNGFYFLYLDSQEKRQKESKNINVTMESQVSEEVTEGE